MGMLLFLLIAMGGLASTAFIIAVQGIIGMNFVRKSTQWLTRIPHLHFGMKESSRSSTFHSPTEWAVSKLEKMDAADDKQIRSHLRIVQLHEAIMRTLLEQEKWFVTKYYDEGYALAALPNLPDSPYQEASRSTMSNVKKRILSKADNFLTEMATCLRI